MYMLLLALMACTAPKIPPTPTPPTLSTFCADRDGWSEPAIPAPIAANVYYVGTCGITALLITSPEGHVLIDTGPAEAVPHVLNSIRALNLDPKDIRYIVGSHTHFDHLGGLAAMQQATGAQIAMRAPAIKVLESGQADADDPQYSTLPTMPPVHVDRVLEDGEILKIGNNALTVVATPGHTADGTSWTWQSCQEGVCEKLAYIDSMTAISAEGYRFSDHPERIAPFRSTFDRVAALDCDLLITPHPSVSNLFDRLSDQAPKIDPKACRALANTMRERLDARLAQEARTE